MKLLGPISNTPLSGQRLYVVVEVFI